MASIWARHFASACFCLIHLAPTHTILMSPFLFQFLSSHLFKIHFLFLVIFHLCAGTQTLVYSFLKQVNKTSFIHPSHILGISHVFPSTHILFSLSPSLSLALFVLFWFPLPSSACVIGLRKTKNKRLTPSLQSRQSGRRWVRRWRERRKKGEIAKDWFA